MTDLDYAMMEVQRVGASDEYFAARNPQRDTEMARIIFDAAFKLGFGAVPKATP